MSWYMSIENKSKLNNLTGDNPKAFQAMHIVGAHVMSLNFAFANLVNKCTFGMVYTHALNNMSNRASVVRIQTPKILKQHLITLYQLLTSLSTGILTF